MKIIIEDKTFEGIRSCYLYNVRGRKYIGLELLNGSSVDITDKKVEIDEGEIYPNVQNKITDMIKSKKFKNNQEACEFGVELLRWLSTTE